MFGWRAVAAAALATTVVAGGAYAGATRDGAGSNWLYGADSSSTLFVIDAKSGATRRIGDTGVRGMTDLAFTPNGRLYGVTFTRFYSIDPDTGRARPIGTGLGFGSVNALASDRRGRLYVANTRGDFGRVAIGSGRVTRLGSYGKGLWSAGDLAFAPDGALYGSASGNVLIRIDPATGAATIRGQIRYPDVYGLAFGPNGAFVGAAHGATAPSVLLAIDRRTGRSRRIGVLAGARGMWALATCPNPGSSPAPQPSERLGTGYFKTPSGNIVCFYSGGPADMPRMFLGCGIRSGLKPAPPRRPCEEGGYAGDRVELSATGRVAVPSCAGDPGALVGAAGAPVLAYGRTWSGGGIRCASATAGLTCRNRSGHGFFLSRERWRAF
jgi:hypothetical protein